MGSPYAVSICLRRLTRHLGFAQSDDLLIGELECRMIKAGRKHPEMTGRNLWEDMMLSVIKHGITKPIHPTPSLSPRMRDMHLAAVMDRPDGKKTSQTLTY